MKSGNLSISSSEKERGKKKIKLFVIKLFIFCAPIFAGLIYVEYKLSEIPNSYSQKKIFLEKASDSVEVLVLGNSEALYAVNPDYFSCKGFNLANISQSVYYDKRLAENYFDKMPKLKLVIIPLSYTSFHHQLYDTKESWRDFYYYRFWGIKYNELPVADIRRFSFVALYSMPEVLKMMKAGFKKNLAKNLFSNGFMKNDTAGRLKNITDISGKRRVALHDSGMIEQRLPEIVKDLGGFLDELAERKIKFVFITTPVCSTYSKFCDKNVLSKNKMIIDSLSAAYQTNYFSYFTDSRFSAEDFTDNDHMNFLGAERFSAILNKEVIEPIIHSGNE